MVKKILIINGNPKTESMCKSIAEQYAKAASAKHEIKQIAIGDMEFDPNLKQGYDMEMPLEKDLLEFQNLIKWSDHIVIVTPVWWGTIPAKFKGLFDRVFLPEFAFKYEGTSITERPLKGRTSELFITLDTPLFWYKWIKGNIIYKHLKHGILDFVGIKNLSTIYFATVINSDDNKRKQWLQKVAARASRL